MRTVRGTVAACLALLALNELVQDRVIGWHRPAHVALGIFLSGLLSLALGIVLGRHWPWRWP